MAEQQPDTDAQAQQTKAEKLGEEFKQLMSSIDSEGIAWTAATSQAIAYDRKIESEREDRLFNDFLAKYLVGERGEKISEVINDALSMHFKVPDFHRVWSAIRTKYINDVVGEWVKKEEEKEGGEGWQVTNLGAGVDTRAFWLECLGGSKKKGKYVEVDVESINGFKERELNKIVPPPTPLCERQVITMDFEKESLHDLPSHNYTTTLPTAWILEGLIMYLKKPEVIKMIETIDNYSVKDSCIIVNYLSNPDPENAANLEYIEKMLLEKGWEGGREVCGGKVIHYGRFPQDCPPAENMGFGTFYKKE